MFDFALQARIAAATLLGVAGSGSDPLWAQAAPVQTVEIGAGARYQAWDYAADLRPEWGAWARFGFAVSPRVTLEAELATSESFTRSQIADVRLLGGMAYLAYNVPAGERFSFLFRGGAGAAKYGDECPPLPPTGLNPCGTLLNLSVGTGARLHITRALALRGDLYLDRPITDTSFFTYGMMLGLSVLPGRQPEGDEDGDGILDRADGCPGTRAGVRVDARGCSMDLDRDGVADGPDRCADTPVGVAVDATGCPRDEDTDGTPDELDRCRATPAGTVVDNAGCPLDQDRDRVPDGLDRCAATPAGAIVDQLGCPVDADGDAVPDGIDRCPSTATGTPVDARGCPSLAGPWTIPARSFTGASPLADAEAVTILDQVAAALAARPAAQVEIRGYGPIVAQGQPGRRVPLERAELTRAALEQRGVAAGRIRTIGFAGQEDPRVVIVLLQGD
jgi:Thrombospondin type 3 repeat